MSALDAFCLLEIFDHLMQKLKDLNIVFDYHKCIGRKLKGHQINEINSKNTQTEITVNVNQQKLDQSSEIAKFEVKF